MDNASYATLTRQGGLRQEMQVIAHNIANATTNGFQKEGLIFSEFVRQLDDNDSALSMATAHAHMVDRTQGQLSQTGGTFDLAIEGEGYFMVQTPEGNRLTRAGTYHPNADGLLATADGALLLDTGEVPIFVPPAMRDVFVAPDGTISGGDQPLGQIGLFQPTDPTTMTRASGARFAVEGAMIPLEEPNMVQGFVEASNVDPVLEVARMIEVQRAYEQGRNLMSSEDERIRTVIQTLGQ